MDCVVVTCPRRLARMAFERAKEALRLQLAVEETSDPAYRAVVRDRADCLHPLIRARCRNSRVQRCRSDRSFGWSAR